jgi:hypothetical protein
MGFTGSVSVTGALYFVNDTPPSVTGFTGTGIVTIEPSSSSFSAALNANYTYGSNLTGLTLGKAGNTADISINAPMTVNAPIRIYGGNIVIGSAVTASNSNLYFYAASNVTQSAAVSASGIALQGGAHFALNNIGNSVSTIAAGDSNNRIASLAFTNASALTVGTVNPAGIYSSGAIHLETLAGNLTIAQTISTTDASENAIRMNAARNTAVGTAAGGDIVISGSPTITAGSGGRISIYTGSIAGSTQVSNYVGAGSGRFRYNSDEATTNYITPLAAGMYAIYREQPIVTIAANNQSMVYGNATPILSTNLTGNQNGDTPAQILSVVPTMAITATNLSSSGQYVAGAHAIGASGATSALGYGLGYQSGTLTVSTRPLSLIHI